MFILWISSTDPDLRRHSRPLASPSPTTILTLTSSFVRLTHQCRPRTRSVAKILTHHHNFVSFFLSFLQFFFFFLWDSWKNCINLLDVALFYPLILWVCSIIFFFIFSLRILFLHVLLPFFQVYAKSVYYCLVKKFVKKNMVTNR